MTTKKTLLHGRHLPKSKVMINFNFLFLHESSSIIIDGGTVCRWERRWWRTEATAGKVLPIQAMTTAAGDVRARRAAGRCLLPSRQRRLPIGNIFLEQLVTIPMQRPRGSTELRREQHQNCKNNQNLEEKVCFS